MLMNVDCADIFELYAAKIVSEDPVCRAYATTSTLDVRRHDHRPSPPYGAAVYMKYVDTVRPVVAGVKRMFVPKFVNVKLPTFEYVV
jgi:hypothetical protein